MTTYYETKGQKIQVLATDPSETIEGQVWYNSTSNTLKVYKNFTDAWSTGGNLGTARDGLGGAGTQTAGLGFGPNSGLTEEYDGSVWTAGGNLAVGRSNPAGAGTQTSGLSFGGYPFANSASTEEYDGSSWTAGGNLAVGRSLLAGCGTQTAALGFGGFRYPTTPLPFPQNAATEEYDGTSWTTGGNLATDRKSVV